MHKSTIAEIRERFDKDVERFSNLDTGQVSTIDAKISLELIIEASRRLVPNAVNLLDVGCGAGNYTLKMLEKLPGINCTLLDLSKPMLDRAFERVSQSARGTVEIVQGDLRDADLSKNHFDIVLAGAVLHHLRDDRDWEDTFQKLYDLIAPGGCLMISDLVTQDIPALTEYTWERYGQYLEEVGGANYRTNVMNYIAKEDSPRSVTYQLDLMKRVGFRQVEVLHKNMCFAAFGGLK